jgi:hypothetical protein
VCQNVRIEYNEDIMEVSESHSPEEGAQHPRNSRTSPVLRLVNV